MDLSRVLNEISNDSALLVALGIPLALLVLVVVVFAALAVARRRRERLELEREVAKLESQTPAEAAADDARDAAAEAEAAAEEAAAAAEVTAGEEPEVSAPPAPPAEGPKEPNWLERLRDGLSKTRDTLWSGVVSRLQSGRVDDGVMEELRTALYRADVGVDTSERLIDAISKRIDRASANLDSLRSALLTEVETILGKREKTLSVAAHEPYVIMVVGVNGVGKTTTIGKLASQFQAQGKTVMLAAGDTFRAAAIDQLAVWGERLGVTVVRREPGSDPAAVAFDAVQSAVAKGIDIVIIDTAGRLHNKQGLMDELAKMKRAASKAMPACPHETWLVLDATTGQNAIHQTKAFMEVAQLSGLIVTKLDGTAKGGVVVAIAEQFELPIYFIGVGEKATDLRGFAARDYAAALL